MKFQAKIILTCTVEMDTVYYGGGSAISAAYRMTQMIKNDEDQKEALLELVHDSAKDVVFAIEVAD